MFFNVKKEESNNSYNPEELTIVEHRSDEYSWEDDEDKEPTVPDLVEEYLKELND